MYKTLLAAAFLAQSLDAKHKSNYAWYKYHKYAKKKADKKEKFDGDYQKKFEDDHYEDFWKENYRRKYKDISKTNLKVGVLSDLHLNLRYDRNWGSNVNGGLGDCWPEDPNDPDVVSAPLGRYSCDPPAELIDVMLDEFG